MESSVMAGADCSGHIDAIAYRGIIERYNCPKIAGDAELLSRDFPFVRVDYYDVDGRAIFGEMTFTPAGGFDASSIPLNGRDMGEYIQLDPC